jgi:hypothetical protein
MSRPELLEGGSCLFCSMKTRLIIFVIYFFAFFSVNGQKAAFTTSKYDHSISLPLLFSSNQKTLSAFDTSEVASVSFSGFPLPKTILKPASLPEYARENPAGHSYLCRLEVKIENKFPLGVWVKVGDSGGIVNSTGNNAHFRLLKRF